MNIREGRMGVQEGAAMAGLALLALGLFGAPAAHTAMPYACGSLGATFALGVFLLAGRAMERLGVRSLFALLVQGLGERGGRIGALCLIGGLVAAAGGLLARFMGMLQTFAFPDAAPWLLLCYLAPAAGALAWIGLEGIGRTARLIALLVLLAVAVALLSGLEQYETFRLLPVDSSGLLLGGVQEIGVFFPACIALLIVRRGLQGERSMARAGIVAVLIGGGAVALARLCLSLAFGPDALPAMDAPLYRLSMSVRTGGYFPRLDQLLLFGWTAGGILAVGLFEYAAALLWCAWFRQRDIRPAALLMAGLSAALSLLLMRELPWLRTLSALAVRWGWLVLALPVLLAAWLGLLRRGLHREEQA